MADADAARDAREITPAMLEADALAALLPILTPAPAVPVATPSIPTTSATPSPSNGSTVVGVEGGAPQIGVSPQSGDGTEFKALPSAFGATVPAPQVQDPSVPQAQAQPSTPTAQTAGTGAPPANTTAPAAVQPAGGFSLQDDWLST